MYTYTKIQRPRFQRNDIIDRYRKSDLHGTSLFSIIVENKSHVQVSFAYSESLQHPTIAILLIQILIFFDHSVVFTCSKVIKAFKRQSSWTDTFPKSSKFIFPKLSSQNMRGLHHATILSPSFHGVHKERLAQWPAFL